ncbi:MAG: 16S rRNA (cytosine(1402)-N(4))-methyltransferase RsmH [Patescibacteria group bacterium]
MSTKDSIHEPVLLEEVIKYLDIKKNGVYIDATMNGGGHAQEILKRVGSKGTVLGIDRDEKLVNRIKKQHIKGLIAEEGNYIHMAQLAEKNHLQNIQGVLFDFGLSSWHLEQSHRGFSFMRDEVLDMRFSESDAITAAHIVNSYSEAELAKIFKLYGEMRYAHMLARAIVQERKSERILTTGRLVDIAKKYIRGGKTHPATQLFQALRIAVNQELDAVRLGIIAAMRLVAPGGRVAAISFHSLEDRIVKNTFREFGQIITKKPILGTREEIIRNPRSRSAKLRAWENL